MVSPNMSPSTSYEHSYAGCNSVQGSRPYNEDTFLSSATFLRVGQDVRTRQPSCFQLHAVFDGHGGAGVSQFCAERVPENLRVGLDNAISDNPALLPSLEASTSTRASDEAVDIVTRVLANAVVATHLQLDPVQHKWVGSTAVISLIYKHHVWVANTGDSRAVRCVNGQPVEVTCDHKASCPREAVRVMKSGGHILYNSGPRLMGVLAVTRAIGDLALQGRGLTAEPDTFHFTRSTDDEFMILASDGLWDVLSNQDAVNLVRRVFEKVGATSTPSDSSVACRVAANVLTRVALAKNSKDNVTTVVIDMRPNQTSQGLQTSPHTCNSAALPDTNSYTTTIATICSEPTLQILPLTLHPKDEPSLSPACKSAPSSPSHTSSQCSTATDSRPHQSDCSASYPLALLTGNTGRMRPREPEQESDEEVAAPPSPPKKAKSDTFSISQKPFTTPMHPWGPLILAFVH